MWDTIWFQVFAMQSVL